MAEMTENGRNRPEWWKWWKRPKIAENRQMREWNEKWGWWGKDVCEDGKRDVRHEKWGVRRRKMTSERCEMMRGRWRKWDSRHEKWGGKMEKWHKWDEITRRRKWDEKGRKGPKSGNRPDWDLRTIVKTAYSCSRLRSEWNDELENLKARFDWRIRRRWSFDAFWRFFALNYKDFWEIREIAENGRNGRKRPKSTRTMKMVKMDIMGT